MSAAPVKKRKPLTMVMEDYLEAIYEISLDKKVVRVRDIASRMKVKMPTVTSMLKNLSSRSLVDYEKYEYVELSPKGKSVAVEMHRRHQVLNRFLTDILKIDATTADEEACKMEHALSSSTLDSLVDFMAFIHECPRAGDEWLDQFEDYRRYGKRAEVCKANLDTVNCGICSQTLQEIPKNNGSSETEK